MMTKLRMNDGGNDGSEKDCGKNDDLWMKDDKMWKWRGKLSYRNDDLEIAIKQKGNWR